MQTSGPKLHQVLPPKVLVLALLLFGSLAAYSQQRGEIIKPATTTVMDPNHDGFVSTGSSGFTGTGFSGYFGDEFELSMFGIPIVGDGEALSDNQAGAQCGITDIIVDSLGYGAYAVLDAANNMVFRFRIGDHNPSVEAYSILIDIDGKMGTDDPNSTPDNPGFEIDITLIKNANKGVYLYNIDGIESCPTPLRNYGFNSNFQIAIADIITCSDLDYFYDFFIPFSDLETLFGVSGNTEMRFVALTNVSGTCAMAGRISDVGGVDDNLYGGCAVCAFVDLGTNQCPTSINNLCTACGGFQSGVTPKPTIDQPVKAGETGISGSAVSGSSIFVDLYNSAHVLKESATSSTGTGCLLCPWSITFNNPMTTGDIISARAKSSSGCSSGGVSSDATITIVVTNVPPLLSGAATLISYTENAAPMAIEGNLNVIDPDNVVMENATVTISANYVSGEDVLTFTTTPGVSGSFNPSTGSISFSGSATLASYQALLRSVSYSNSSENPTTVVRTISMVINDGFDNSNIFTRSVSVTSVNDAPVAVDNSASTPEDTPTTVTNISANDTDVDGTVNASTIDLDPAIAGQQTTSTTSQGTWSVTSSGDVSFSPVLNFNGVASRTYTVADNAAAVSNTATISVTVTAVNDPPIAVNDLRTTNEDVAVNVPNVTSNDTDIDDAFNLATIDIDPVNPGIQQTIAAAEGGWTVNGNGSIDFVPTANFNGTASINYVVADNTGALSNVATVSIQVLAVNDAPVAVDDNGATNEGTPVTINNITANDTDVDGAIDVASVDLDPVAPGQQTSATVPQGQWNVDASANVTFTPVANFNGTVLRTYTVLDNDAALSNSANITVVVNAVNNLPVANNDGGVTNEDVPVTLAAITTNDTDLDGTIDPATVDLDPLTGGIQTTFSDANGSWTVNGTADVTFTPASGFVGNASITYTVNDNAGGTSNAADILVIVNDVIAGNTPPIAVNDATSTSEETPVTLTNVTSNDSDADGSLNLATVDLDPLTAGTQTILVTTQGDWSVNATADVSFNPAPNFFGISSHIYTVQDDDGATSNSATITITVTPVNDAPTATNDSGATSEGTPVVLSQITSNDTDIDGTIDATTIDLDPATVGKQTTLTTTDGDWEVDGTGNVTFTPTGNFNGTAAASYTVSDNGGAISNEAALNVLVNPTNDAPVAVDDSGLTLEDNEVIIADLTSNDTDIDGSIVVSTIDLDPSTPGKQSTLTNIQGSWIVGLAGELTYTPALNFNGTASIAYTVNDDGGALSNSANVTIVVTSVNDLPVAVADAGIATEDIASTLPNITSNDTDVDGSVNPATIDLDPATPGTQTSLTKPEGIWTVDGSGAVTFNPALNFNGIAAATYTVQDDELGVSAISNIEITVTPVNDIPVLENLSLETHRNVALQTSLISAGDMDPDGTPLLINTIPANAPDHGIVTLNSDGTFVYTPSVGYIGSDLLEVEFCDGGLPLPAACAIKEVHIVVLPGNTAPVPLVNAVPGNAMTATTPEDTPISLCFDVVDADGDPVTINSITNMTGGGTLVPFGAIPFCYQFTPDTNFFGPSQWNVIVCDNGSPALCGSLTITIEVTSVNDAPVAVSDLGATNENVAVVLPNITANDTDVDGTLAASTIDLDPFAPGQQTLVTVLQGVWSVDVSGGVTFAPATNFNGTVICPYTVLDNEGEVSNSANITIVVNAVNNLPVANNDGGVTNEDVPVTLAAITTNDTDVDGTIDPATVDLDPLTGGIQTTFSDANGSWTVNATADVTFTPASGFVGNATITYTVKDNAGGTSNAADIHVIVNDVVAGNTPPIAVDDAITTSEETPVTLTNVTSNDSDADGSLNLATVDLDPLTAGTQTTLVTTQGDWSVNATADVSFNPVLNFFGTTSSIYTIQDDDAATSNSATITITVTPVNDPPIAADDGGATNEGTSVVLGLITSNDTDIDGTIDVTTIDLDPANVGKQTTLTTADGDWDVDADGNVTFTPNGTFNGTAAASYTVNDNGGAISNEADLTVLVNPSNDAPVAVNDSGITTEDVETQINVVSNDVDEDGTVVQATVDLQPLVSDLQSAITTSEGTWTVSLAGTVRFIPTADFNGVATIQYTVNDNSGATSNDAAITITVTPVNDPPIAGNDSGGTSEGIAVVLDLITSNDTDIDGTVDASTVDLAPASAGRQTTLTTAAGDWQVDAGGNVTFSPNATFNGVATASYRVNDNGGAISNSASLTIVVNAVNDLPVANNDGGVTNEDVPVTLTGITVNDTDVDGTIDPSTVDLDPLTGGKQTSLSTPEGTWTVNASADVTFIPTSGFVGSTSITYTVNDNSGGTSNAATILVVVNDVVAGNIPPTAVDNIAATSEDTPVTITNITANDSDVDGTVDLSTIDLDPLTAGLQTALVTSQGDWSVSASADVSFSPVLNFFGTASHIYTVQDDDGATSNSATITITVNAVNDAPIAGDDSGVTNKGIAVVLGLITSNDTDIDGTVDATTVDLDPTAGGKQTTFSPVEGEWQVDAAGNVTFTPNATYSGTATASYTVNDDGGASSNEAGLTILVNATNDPPVAVDDLGNTIEDAAVQLDVTSNDIDEDGTVFQATVDLQPFVADLQSSATTVEGAWTVTPTGTVKFIPTADFNGTATIQYTVNDNSGAASNPATVTISVDEVNDPPILEDLSFQTNRNQPVHGIILTAGDIDPEGTLVVASTTPAADPVNGSVIINVDGTFIYTPNLDYVGGDVFGAEACDNGIPLPGACSVKQVVITIEPANGPPVIIVNSTPGATLNASTPEDTPITLCFDAVDPDGDPIVISSITNIEGGGTLAAFGSVPFCFQFTPAPNFTGTSRWTLLACDNGVPPLCGSLAITIDVTPVNDAPSALPDTIRTFRNVQTSTNLLDNDSDVEGQALSISATPVRSTSHGDVTLSPNGDLYYLSEIKFRGIDSLVYEVCDTATPAGCSYGRVVILVEDLELKVYEGITPNGDGNNDYLRIDGIDFYTENEVMIFDRYNNLVFQIRGYNNDDRVWTGHANRGLGGAELPEETYFYSVNLGNGGPPMTGFVILKRQ